MGASGVVATALLVLAYAAVLSGYCDPLLLTSDAETVEASPWRRRHVARARRAVHPGERGLWAMILDFSATSVALTTRDQGQENEP